MPIFGTDTSDQAGKFSCASAAQRTLKDLRTKRKGQPVFVVGHRLERKGKEATFEVFNDRLAIIRFDDDAKLGYDPLELLLPTEIDEQGWRISKFAPAGSASNSSRLRPTNATPTKNRPSVPTAHRNCQLPGCAKSPSSKAAASEASNRTRAVR
ncbi:MAG: hypothetical protein IPO99_03105 [Nitrospira sp.]|nr:hypothetical protein [Nitrospira sp.]